MDEQTKLFIDISRNLGEINSKLGSLCEVIAKHESRITELEKDKVGVSGLHFKELAVWLVKGLIIALGTIATMTGSASLIKGIFGM